MQLDFYHWSYQCPINHEMINLLSLYKEQIDIKIHDISFQPELAEEKRMFFPTLTIVNKERRYFSPLKKSFMESLCRNEFPVETPYIPVLGTTERVGKIVPLTADNYYLAEKCTGLCSQENCQKKQVFLRENSPGICGFLNLDEADELLGGVEFLPSLLVPYAIHKDTKTAFITCIYLSDDKYDYKSAPLRKLEEYLSSTFDRILVISDENSVFPNGNKAFFEKNGYSDNGVISHEEGYCTLHLMSKSLYFSSLG